MASAVANHAAGLTRMNFCAFLWATTLGELPAILNCASAAETLTGGAENVVTGVLVLLAGAVLLALWRATRWPRKRQNADPAGDVGGMDAVKAVHAVKAGCVDCSICVKECAFLQKYGTPGEICRQPVAPASAAFVFDCSLCGLCDAVCPKKLEVTGAFLAIRTAVQHHGRPEPVTAPADRRHSRICSYARYGGSPLLSHHRLPQGAKTVFFPGCTLAGTRAAVTLRTYHHLQRLEPSCGIVLDCCGKPFRDLGLADEFQRSFSRLADKLKKAGVETILAACPSCYVTFREYLPECVTRSVYETLAEQPPIISEQSSETVVIHDACTTRDVPQLHEAVRALVTLTGAGIEEMDHTRRRTLCCGEGGAAAMIAPALAGQWQNIRRREAGGSRIITYCAGCSTMLGKSLRTTHLLDLLFDPDHALTGREQRTRPPFTYLNRWRLKRRLKRTGFA